MPNYSFVIDSTYNPFTMQEMVAPLAMYKDAFDKSEAAFEDLTDKADKFKYLSMTLPEGSKGRQIYENYSNELNKQAEDLARNGLSVNNRMALRNLRRRYQGEIGRLDLADQALQEERKLRRQMNAKDSSMLYAEDNLSIDNFLDGATPNLYNISGTELYTRGAAAGKAASSRMYSSGDEGSTLNGYYRKWTERYGYSKESMDAFRANASAIPELQQAAENILAERGALDNLSGANLERARQSVLNGIIDGAVYQEKVNPVRDEGKLSAAQEASNALGWANHNLSAASSGMVKDSSSPTGYRYDITKDPRAARKEGTKKEKNTTEEDLKPAPDPKVRFNSKGEMQEAKGTANNPLNYGTPISYADALANYPDVVSKFDKEKYNFYVNGDWIYPVPKTAEELKSKGNTGSSSASTKSTSSGGSNHNAL